MSSSRVPHFFDGHARGFPDGARVKMNASLGAWENGVSKLACILLYSEVWPFPTERRGLKGRKSLKKTKKEERKDLQ